MGEQLKLFDEHYLAMNNLLASANQLIDLLNDGRKAAEVYNAEAYHEIKGLYLFVASNKDKKRVFNVLTSEGKTPEGFSANWRNYNHIRHELNLQ